MLGWVVFALVCLYILRLLTIDSSPTKHTPANKTSIIVQSVIKEQQQVPDNINQENEVAKKKKVRSLDNSRIKNVAGIVNNPCSWFIVDRAQNNPMSAAEKIIAEQLDLYNVEWYKEVAFEGLKFTNYGYPRYDFLLVIPGRQIQIIEYDGKFAHSNPEQIAKDKIKTEFCKKHQIPLIRYSAVHYYKMGYEISKLMNSYGITKKKK